MSSFRPSATRPVLGLVTALALVLVAQAAAGEKYTVDPVHSSARFSVRHLNVGNVHGRFDDLSGSFEYDEGDPSKSHVALTIKTASVNTANAKRDRHLRSPDFFNAKQHPVITFKSTKVVKNADGTLTVTGDLTLRGTTKSVTGKIVPVGAGKGMKGEYRRGFDVELTVHRMDFGVSFMPNGLGKDIPVRLSVEGIRQ